MRASRVVLSAILCVTLLGVWACGQEDSDEEGSSGPAYKYYVFGVNTTAGTISTYTQNSSTGALTLASSLATGASPRFVTVHPNGRYLYVSHGTGAGGSNSVQAYSINRSTGALTAVGAAVAAGYGSIAISPNGLFLYVGEYGSATTPVAKIFVFTINATTGALTAGTPASVNVPATGGYGVVSIAVNPAGTFLYVSNNHDNDIYVYAINSTTGALTVTGGSPFGGTNINICGIAIAPAGNFLYAIDNQAGGPNVGSFALNTSSGDVSGGSMVNVTEQQSGVPALSPNGKCLYVTNGPGKLSGYLINTTTGAMSEATGSPYTGPGGGGSGPFGGVTIDAEGAFVHVSGPGNNISSYSVNSTTCELTALSPATIAAGGVAPLGIAAAKIQQ